MSLKNVEKMPQAVVEKTWFQRFNTKLGVAAAGVSTALVVGSAHAEGAGVDTLFTNVSTDLGGVATGVLAVLGILAGVTALLIGWSYLRRTR